MSELRKWWDDRYGLTQSYNPWPYQLMGLFFGLVRNLRDKGYQPVSTFGKVTYCILITLMCLVFVLPICLTNSQPKNGVW